MKRLLSNKSRSDLVNRIDIVGPVTVRNIPGNEAVALFCDLSNVKGQEEAAGGCPLSFAYDSKSSSMVLSRVQGYRGVV